MLEVRWKIDRALDKITSEMMLIEILRLIQRIIPKL